jgi:hypothetical protein
LQSKYDAEMKKFEDAGVSDIYYSTFSSILMEAAKKVGKESGDFSDAYASGIGEAFGTQFGNIITEIMDRAVGDNSALDDYMLSFSEKLKEYTEAQEYKKLKASNSEKKAYKKSVDELMKEFIEIENKNELEITENVDLDEDFESFFK